MKAHSGGLGSFLNEVTQKSEKVAEEEKNFEKIIYVDIDEIESNPKNFYGLRNIDELAGLIAVSHLIEPLTVIKKSDGKYKLISGHRRRAAVQKLLEEGNYSERKLPCIVKASERIRIEQESGETIEFDEEAVEMLNLIASNRGQREERTIDEKMQEVKYLEEFARAIYNRKQSRHRGRFASFFAEEILNISKSQFLRINSLEKLTPNVRKAIDEKQISETAAMEMTNMTADEQESCLEKILSGKIKGTVQEIQKAKIPQTEEKAAESPVKVEEEISSENVTEEISNQAENAKAIAEIMEVPEEIGDPQKEAEEWFYQGALKCYELMYVEAKGKSATEPNELKASQWGIRASVARYKIEELKINHSK